MAPREVGEEGGGYFINLIIARETKDHGVGIEPFLKGVI